MEKCSPTILRRNLHGQQLAQSGRVHALNAGWASYLGETDPKTIPGPTTPEAAGRKTMVSGFMAGIGALHQRFGALPWADILTPSIWYAEKGVPVSDRLAGYFRLRAKDFDRTADGREFMRQAGADAPKSGTLFVQPRLAETLRAVAQQGPAYPVGIFACLMSLRSVLFVLCG